MKAQELGENLSIHSKTWVVLAAVLCGVVCAGILLQRPPARGLSYEGSSTLGTEMIPALAQAFVRHGGQCFEAIRITGSKAGFEAVMAGKGWLGGLSSPLQRAEKRRKPYYRIIGYDGIGVYVHPHNPVHNLSKQQLKGIFTGQITRWHDVGGQDAAIVVIAPDKSSGTRQFFQDIALDGLEYQETDVCGHSAACPEWAARNAQAITIASLSNMIPGIQPLSIDNISPSKVAVLSGDYLLSRPLLLVTKHVPTEELQRFFDCVLSTQGQQIVAQYFVPVR